MNYDKIYETIAQKYGISKQEVRDEIMSALKAGWENENNSDEVKERQKEIPSKDEIPTPEDVIDYLVDNIKNEM